MIDDHDAQSTGRKSEARAVLCPSCGKEVQWSAAFPFRPFCSERCKLIDFGQWASEQYRVPADNPDPDEKDEPSPDAGR